MGLRFLWTVSIIRLCRGTQVQWFFDFGDRAGPASSTQKEGTLGASP
jgi:hypothetical protein